jgi:plastocyanin
MMPRLKKAPTAKPDVLEVIHHVIPDTAAGAGAEPIPAASYRASGMTWRRMLRAVAIAEVAGLAVLFTAGTIYGLDFFAPLFIGMLLFLGAALWVPRMSKASAIYALTVSSLMFVMMGVLFFGWTGFFQPQSWFEVGFATFSTLVPLAGIVAGIAVLRHKDGIDAAKTPSRVVAVLAAVLLVMGLVGSAMSSDATRLPGDVTLKASNFEFSKTAITAKAGDVAIYLDNQDPFAHNIKIDGHGQSKDANGRQSIRYVFRNLTAGAYAFYCTIHPDEMKGTLTVT